MPSDRRGRSSLTSWRRIDEGEQLMARFGGSHPPLGRAMVGKIGQVRQRSACPLEAVWPDSGEVRWRGRKRGRASVLFTFLVLEV